MKDPLEEVSPKEGSRIVDVRLSEQAHGVIQRRYLRRHIKLRIKTFYGERKTLDLIVDIEDKADKLRQFME